jgi:hypothetical protein
MASEQKPTNPVWEILLFGAILNELDAKNLHVGVKSLWLNKYFNHKKFADFKMSG